MDIDDESNALDEFVEKAEIVYPSTTPLFKKYFPYDISAIHCSESHSAFVLEDNKNN